MGFRTEQKTLVIGDFAWVIEITTHDGKSQTCILDYIIERKKADDLASSIIDGRYKDQKLRLKQCGITKIWYLIEGSLSGNFTGISERAIQSAVVDTSVFHKYSVKETASTDESISFLKVLHNVILRKTVKWVADTGDSEFLTFKSDYTNFVAVNKLGAKNTVSYLFLQSLNGIKGMGKESISWIANYFSNFNAMYNFFHYKFDNVKMTPGERGAIGGDLGKKEKLVLKFLNGLANRNQREKLVTLFTANQYP